MVLQPHHPLLTPRKLKLSTTTTLLHQLIQLLNHPQDRLKTLLTSINFKNNFNLVQKCTTVRSTKIYLTKRRNPHDSNLLANDVDKLGMTNLIAILPFVRLYTARYAYISENDNRCIADTSTFPPSHFEECKETYHTTTPTRTPRLPP